VKNVTLSAKKLHLGFDTLPFVGHDIDSTGLNMTKKRIDSTINFATPGNLKELQSFLGLVNYFRDHIPGHSNTARHLHQMVTTATSQRSKQIVWTPEGQTAFDKLKRLVNHCPKLYFIDTSLKVILYTDASDYAHGAYLCQVRPGPDGTNLEEPIRFLSGTFSGAQTRWSTIEKEAYAIYWALKKLDELVGGIPFTIRTDHRNLLYMNNHGSRKVLQWKLDIQHYNAVIEHVPGELNIPADVFSRLVPQIQTTTINQILVVQCSDAQRALIKTNHEWLHAHSGVDRTLALLTQRHPEETSKDNWPHLRRDVRDYIRSCPTCQKMDTRHQVIRSLRIIHSGTDATYCIGYNRTIT
jgi:hypothetical protein